MGKNPGKKLETNCEKNSASKKPEKVGGTAIKVRHILCEKEKKILEALKLLNQGTSFIHVATSHSEDKARQGGLLGWKTKGQMVPEFEQAAFNLPLNCYTKTPVKTQFGYHLILVEERK